MPDRIVRAGILTSDAVNSLSWAAEVFYRRLMNVADDFGRYDGRESVLRAALYALKVDRVSVPDIGKWIGECQEAGLVRRYTVDGKPYLELPKFGQKIRTQKSKWPDPPADVGNYQQVLADVPVVVDVVEVDIKAMSGKPDGEFSQFWKAYPRKTQKQAALKAWKRLRPDDALQGVMLAAIGQQSRSDQWQRGIIPHPATWLNGKRWEDDLGPAVQQEKPLTCSEIVAGDVCGMPGKQWGGSVYCEHHIRKRTESREIPPEAKRALEKITRAA